MTKRHGPLTVLSEDKDLVFGNDLVRVCLRYRDGGYAEEFFALDRRGNQHLILSSLHRDLITSSEHRVMGSPVVSGSRPHLLGVTRDSLRMVYSDVQVRGHTDQEIVVEMSGSFQEHSLRCTMRIGAESNSIAIEVEDSLKAGPRPPLVEYLMSTFVFMPCAQVIRCRPDDCWTPTLRPGPDHVIGDCCFGAPAVYVRKEALSAALVPDLETVRSCRTMPLALDLDQHNGLVLAPVISYGFCGYELTEDSTYCRHDVRMSEIVREPTLRYAFQLILDAGRRTDSLANQVAGLLWRMGSAGNSRQACGAGSDLMSADVAPAIAASPFGSLDPLLNASEKPHAIFDPRTVYGLHAAGLEAADWRLLSSAAGTKKRLVSACLESGPFPWEHEDGLRSTAQCSEMMLWLLRWYQRVERDKLILACCRSYADAIVGTIPRNGAVPSWLESDGEPVPGCVSRSDAAATARFLLELAQAGASRRYRRAAERCARFALWIMPDCDHTLTDPQNGSSRTCPDPHSGCYPKTAWSLLQIAEMCFAFYSENRSRRYLSGGIQAADELCLMQSVWDNPWTCDGSGRGMCASGNTGIESDPTLTADFAHCMLMRAAITGEPDYAQRASAALQAALGADTDALSQARIRATVNVILSEFGTAYVHVGNRWLAPVLDHSVHEASFERGAIRLTASQDSPFNGHRRVVFGGMRGKKYSVSVNGETRKYTREELMRGIGLR